MWWAWAGEGRARQPGDHWAPGDDLLGDPPHEPQGWYSVFDADAQAGAAIASAAAFAARILSASRRARCPR